MKKPLVLCILDGWGLRNEASQNAIALGKTPHWDSFLQDHPYCALEASGEFVGLPEGQMGNSEVGHTCIGAGRVIWQSLPRIDHALSGGTLKTRAPLEALIQTLKKTGKACHLMGLLSPGGVHSHQDHILGLAQILDACHIPVYIHAFLDGRDTPPMSAHGFLKGFQEALKPLPHVSFGTFGGRYFAMDRDQRWDRVQKAYDVMVEGSLPHSDPLSNIKDFYNRGTGDEFIPPFSAEGYPGIQDGDGMVMGNFRADRVRQILSAFLKPDFEGFSRGCPLLFSKAVGMTPYSKELLPLIDPLFPKIEVERSLGEVLSENGLAQLRIAETEKYAHVTFFFNGGREEPFENESRILVPSPKVATYDLKPEMSAPEITDHLLKALQEEAFDVIVVNYANPDMVGHTGNLDAAIQAVETVDQCLGRLKEATLAQGGTLMITADHGNVEMMQDLETGKNHTAHTLGPVPFVLVGESSKRHSLQNGSLKDIAPTILGLMGLQKPKEMTGKSLLA